MEKELKRISENVLWLKRKNAVASIYGDAVKMLIGKSATYIIGELAKLPNAFEFAYHIDGVRSDNVWNLRKGNNSYASAAYPKNVRHIKESGYESPERAAKVAESDAWLKNALKGDADISFDAERTAEAAVGQSIFQMSKGLSLGSLGEITALGSVKAAFQDELEFYRLKNDVETAAFEEWRPSGSFRNYAEDDGVYKSVEYFDTAHIYGIQKTERTETYGNGGAAVDIGFIGEALAQQMHEQISAGFPMYVR